MNFEQVKQQEQANMMHTYGRFPVALVKGKGVTAWDTEGKDYIDFTVMGTAQALSCSVVYSQ